MWYGTHPYRIVDVFLTICVVVTFVHNLIVSEVAVVICNVFMLHALGWGPTPFRAQRERLCVPQSILFILWPLSKP